MAPIAAASHTILTSSSNIIALIPLATLKFGSSSVTFANDIDAYTTVDIN
jgi:hypothetical protein